MFSVLKRFPNIVPSVSSFAFLALSLHSSIGNRLFLLSFSPPFLLLFFPFVYRKHSSLFYNLEKQTPDYCFDKIKSRRAGENERFLFNCLLALQIGFASCRIDKTPPLIDSRFPREACRQLKSRDEPSEEFSDDLSIKHDVEEKVTRKAINICHRP
jgi:hypothetical protein